MGTVIYKFYRRQERKIMKNTFKSILAAMLTLAITLTSVLTGDPMTAHAEATYLKGVEDATNLDGTTIAMKPGDIKKVYIQYSATLDDGYVFTDNITHNYRWESSNDNAVRIIREWGHAGLGGNLMIARCALVAEKTGTAIITATNWTGNEKISFTVNVTTPKKTAKQLKCRHKWVTTRKSNCFWPGVKTCKKCKLQKTIARKEHQFVTKTEDWIRYKYRFVYQCGVDLCGKEYDLDHVSVCDNWCTAQFDPLDYEGETMKEKEEAAKLAMLQHQAKENHDSRSTRYIQVPTQSVTTDCEVTKCAICDYYLYDLNLMEQVNEPGRYLTETEADYGIHGEEYSNPGGFEIIEKAE